MDFEKGFHWPRPMTTSGGGGVYINRREARIVQSTVVERDRPYSRWLLAGLFWNRMAR